MRTLEPLRTMVALYAWAKRPFLRNQALDLFENGTFPGNFGARVLPQNPYVARVHSGFSAHLFLKPPRGCWFLNPLRCGVAKEVY